MHTAPLDELSAGERAIALEMLEQLGDHTFLWAIVTGTHQYGFTSPDSDIDVRGMYTSDPREHLGLALHLEQHAEYMGIVAGREADCLAFEMGRFAELLLKHAGNVLEELFSPLVLVDTGRLEAFRHAVRGCLSTGFARHYIGFFEACIKKLRRGKKAPEVKTALYACRIALTGITLLSEGEVEAHLPTLAQKHGIDWVDEWIALKVTEHEPVPEGRLDEMLDRLGGLRRELHRAHKRSQLPPKPEGLEALHALMVEVRLEGLDASPQLANYSGIGSDVQ